MRDIGPRPSVLGTVTVSDFGCCPGVRNHQLLIHRIELINYQCVGW